MTDQVAPSNEVSGLAVTSPLGVSDGCEDVKSRSCAASEAVNGVALPATKETMLPRPSAGIATTSAVAATAAQRIARVAAALWSMLPHEPFAMVM